MAQKDLEGGLAALQLIVEEEMFNVLMIKKLIHFPSQQLGSNKSEPRNESWIDFLSSNSWREPTYYKSV